MSIPLAKARALPPDSTPTGPLPKRGVQADLFHSRLKVPSKSLDAQKNDSCIRRHASGRRHDAHTTTLVGARGIAVFTLAVRAWYQIKACERLKVGASMECSLTMLADVVSANARTCGSDCKPVLNFATWHDLWSF